MRHCTICCQVLRQIGDGIAGGLDGAGGPGEAGGGGGVDAGGVIHKIGIKALGLDFSRGQVPGELVENGGDHFHMRQFFCTDICTEMKPTRQRQNLSLPSGVCHWLLLSSKENSDTGVKTSNALHKVKEEG